MIEPFIHQAMATRVIFGAGTLTQVGAEVEHLGARRALVLSTPGRGAAQGEMVASLLGEWSAGVFTGAVIHTPVEVTDQALRVVTERGADALVSVGGGSTIGLGKALALRTDLPQIVLPTTYAGSEMTPILGETRGGVKTTLKDARIQPETVIYDVELGLDLPASASATSGINAIAHAVEALYARDRNPVTSLLAEEGIACLSRALPQIIREPRNLEARTTALYGAWLCGGCLGMVGMALHHKLCHVLGGRFSLPHAETHHRLAACRGLQCPGHGSSHGPTRPSPGQARPRLRPLRSYGSTRRPTGAARDRHASGWHRRGRRADAGRSLLEPSSSGASSAARVARTCAASRPARPRNKLNTGPFPTVMSPASLWIRQGRRTPSPTPLPAAPPRRSSPSTPHRSFVSACPLLPPPSTTELAVSQSGLVTAKLCVLATAAPRQRPRPCHRRHRALEHGLSRPRA